MSGAIDGIFELIQENTSFVFIMVSVIILVIFFSLAIIFTKIKQKFWKALIPVYNMMFLMNLLNIPVWMVFVIFIPFVNMIGIPFMFLLIGWKLGDYCHKNIFIKIGLMLCPPLFYPILAATEIDLENQGKKILAPERLPDSFSLEAVDIENIDSELKAMSLEDEKTMEKMMPRKRTVVESSQPKKNGKKEFYSVPTPTNNYEVEDLSVALPTADDLTFDYNSLYQINTESDRKSDIPILQETIKPEETIKKDIVPDLVKEKEVEEEALPVVHDILLEEAKPVTEDIGPILINQRDEFKNTATTQIKEEILSPSEFILKPKEMKETNLEENNSIKQEANESFLTNISPNTVDIPITAIEDISDTRSPITFNNTIQNPYTNSFDGNTVNVVGVEEKPSSIEFNKNTNLLTNSSSPIVSEQPVTVEEANEDFRLDSPNLAVSPFEEDSPKIAEVPEITMPIEDLDGKKVDKAVIEEYKAPEIEPGTRIDQIISMDIAEPSQLPVGVLTPEEVEQEKIATTVSNPTVTMPIPNTVNQTSSIVSKEERVGLNTSQNFSSNSNIQKMENMTPNRQQVFTPLQQTQQQSMVDSNFIQQNPTAIFQTGLSSGESLLRTVDSNPTPTTFMPSATGQKTCPVCGVKLKLDCPTCFMCGFKF